MLHSMRAVKSRPIGLRLTPEEWESVNARRVAKESVSACIRRLLTASNGNGHHPPDTPVEHSEPVSPTVVRFLKQVFPDRDTHAVAQTARWLVATLAGPGIARNGTIVRAVDVTHVAQCCQDYLDRPARDRWKSWTFWLLDRLADTYDETKAARLDATPTAEV